jgi:hypothetical protein
MAWSNLQKPATAAGQVLVGSTIAQTFAGGCTNGSRTIVAVGCWKSANVTCTGVGDTVNTYTKDIDLVNGVSGVHTSIWSAPNTSTSALTITATISATGADASICINEFSGLSTTSGAGARDGTATGTSTGGATTTTTSTSPTTTAANELAFATLTGNGDLRAFSVGAGWTLGQNNAPDGAQDILTEWKDTGASGSAISGTATEAAGNGNNTILLSIYKLAAVGAPLVPPEQPPMDQAVNRATTY